ncbi:hypothetical protein [Polyangium spumosum]|uniref:Lipoprotein n=1 Tax=Polyangium spumosum TaxID=889282 RepID=A0A6N7PR88_9BACT|nr:hypothetical protein [Polyangium spumosum]MRG94127.1 hypothetical protein [Polyangium spumosum]
MLERFRFLAVHPLSRAAVLLALPLAFAACGSKVVIDGGGATGGGGSGAGGAGGSGSGGDDTLQCGEEPKIGKLVAVCVTMDGDFCPPAETSPVLLGTLAKVMGVCAETSPAACCGEPALRQVVCDLPPSNDECCYHVHYLENAGCP